MALDLSVILEREKKELDFDFYLTSLEPNIAQLESSQSLGGYRSTTLLYPKDFLYNTVGLYNTSFELYDYTDLAGLEYVGMNGEIIKVEEIFENVVTVIQRGVNNIVEVHLGGDEVRGITNTDLFNDVFNDEYKQYRCIAIKNNSINTDPSIINSTSYNTGVYIMQNSINPDTSLKVAIEIPKNQYLESTSTSWTNMTIVDTSLSGYEDNYFQNSYLKIKDGPNSSQNRIISSFDSSTFTLVFQSSLPVDYSTIYSSNILYEIEPSPAQRVKTGTESPITGDRISDFVTPGESFQTNVNINNKLNGDILATGDIFYIWFERTLKKGSPKFDNNSIVVVVNYRLIP